MKIRLIFFLLMLLALVSSVKVIAQDATDAAQKAENLRLQLVEIQGKEGELQIRLHQLDEALKPENIESSLAGVGSTRPEELRESRRRQLQAEKNGVVAQLATLADSRTRLEASLRTAETQAYHDSAKGLALAQEQPMVAKFSAIPVWLILALAGLLTVTAIVTLTAIRRRRQRSS